MGEVYRARDPSLGRDVAVKVLPAGLSPDEGRRRRFLQEARSAAGLHHPGIVAIHALESVDGHDVIVMEHVAGRTLDAVIRSGLRLGEALRIAIQVADALAAAHAAGVVHRDLKPGNVMVTPEGAVKVLDFGLAKLVAPEKAGGEDEPTLSEIDRPNTLSRAGTIAGTPGYMSPEQATGETVDARSDVFAFGALLYEMVTGRRAFSGATREETLRAVRAQPVKPPSEVAPGVPAHLERLIQRCLRKEPERRFQHMSDVKVELQEILEEPAGAVVARPRRWAWRGAGLVVAALGAVAGWQAWRSADPALPPPRLVPLTTYKGVESEPALSPDGEQVAFSWEGEGDTGSRRPARHIWVQFVGGSEHRQLTSGPDDDSWPSWSPDGREIAFVRLSRSTPRVPAIHLVSPLGGPPRRLGDFPAAGPLAWTADGRGIVVGRAEVEGDTQAGRGAIHLLSLADEPPRILTRPVEGGFDRHPSLSPDGRSLAYASCQRKAVAPLAPCHVQIVDLEPGGSAAPRRLSEKASPVNGLAWSPDGRSVLYEGTGSPANTALWRLDAAGGRPPERIELAGRLAGQPFVSARRGRLVFSARRSRGEIWALDTSGPPRPLLAGTNWHAIPRYSPDGRRIAYMAARTDDSFEVWLADADGSNQSQLTRGPGWMQGSQRWSPDGRRIVFASHGENAHSDVWTIDVAGGPPRRVPTGPLPATQPAWSPDGRLIYYRQDRPDGSDIWRVPESGGAPERETHRGGYNPLALADGRTLLYTRRRYPSPLVARDIESGTEKQMLDCVNGSQFDVGPGGLYYVGCSDEDLDRPLYRLDTRTGRRELLGRLRTDRLDGLSVSPLGGPILYYHFVDEADLMMIENFR
jgi:Tol biopolymer transport system component